MTALLSLPRMPSQALAATALATRGVRLGVSAATRARAARRLAQALRAGRIEPAAALAAVEQGDEAVARLLRPLTPEVYLPSVQSNALDCLPKWRHFTTEHLASLLPLARAFVRSGDLPLRDLQQLAAGKPDSAGLTVLLQRAWQCRVERLTARIVPRTTFREADLDVCFAVTLGPVLQAIEYLAEPPYSTFQMLDDPLPGGVLCELIADPLFRLPAHPIKEPDFFRAFNGVWQHLQQIAKSPLLAGLDPSFMDFGSWMGEAIADAIASATWRNGKPTFTVQSREQFQAEFDIDLMERADDFAACVAWQRAANIKPLEPGSRAFNRWLRERATRRQAAFVRRLLGITDRLQQATDGLPTADTNAWGGQGVIAVMPVPADFGVDDLILHAVEDMYNQGEPPVWQAALDPKKRASAARLLALADRIVLEAVAATACLNEIRHYAHAA